MYFRESETGMTTLSEEETLSLNHSVHQYLISVSTKLAAKFKKEFCIEENKGESDVDISFSLEDIVKRHQEDDASLKRKREVTEEGDEEKSEVKKKVKKERPKKKTEVNRKTIFIRGIDKDFDFDQHKSKFQKFGKIFGFTNSKKGHGFLTFSSPEEAAACIEALDNAEVGGRKLQLNLARGNQGREEEDNQGCKLFVHGVKQEVKEEALKLKFSAFGKVVDCFNPGKGFAFVTFETPEQAKAAMDDLNETEYNGSKISINVSKPKEKPKEESKKKKKKMKAADIADRFGSESARVFVKNIDKDADLDEVRKLFETHGTVKDVYNPGKGFVFVRYLKKLLWLEFKFLITDHFSFAESSEAEAAVAALDGESALGKVIQCNIARFKKHIKKKKDTKG